MQFDDNSVDVSGVDDQRGRGIGGLGAGGLAFGGGGLGIVGLIIYLVVNALGGGSGASAIDPGGISAPPAVDGSGSGETQQELASRCNQDGAIQQYEDCYMIKVYNEVNEVWSQEFSSHGETYSKPALGFYSQAVRTGCGTASSQVGPFYCPPDREIYLDLGFLQELQQRFGAQGRYAQAYILAHEAGHHLQTLFGTEPKVRQAQQAHPSQTNELSVALELQADCYAGVYGRLANDSGHQTITDAELQQAVNAAAAVGDDRIQRETQGQVDPESFTHGTSQQRQHWFLQGYQSGDVQSCDTFSSLLG